MRLPHQIVVKWPAAVVLAVIIAAIPARATDRGRIFFSAATEKGVNIWCIQPDGKDLKQITSGSGTMRFPAISPDGKRMVCINDKRMPALIDLESAKIEPVPIPDGIYAHPAWTPSGDALLYVRYLVLPSDQSEIWRIERHNGFWQTASRITGFPPMFLFPAPCPGDSLLACTQFKREKKQRAIEEICLMKMDGSDVRRLTKLSTDSYGPKWSPEGKRILFTSNSGGDYNVWRYDLKDGSIRQLTSHGGFDGEPSWSPDGRAFVFVSTRSGTRQLWMAEIGMMPAHQLTHMNGNVMNPVWGR